jgi:L-ascorbate metabolism protein UlaG (beta-lactamase superfamily)
MKIKIIFITLILATLIVVANNGLIKEEEDMSDSKKYKNTEETETMVNFRFQTLIDFMFKKEKEPNVKFDFVAFDSVYYQGLDEKSLSVNWFGHSSGLLEIEGKLILFDPVFSNRVGPLKGTGTKRFHKSAPLNASQLPPVDIVLISHDHYDHLDKQSIKDIKDKTGLFIVPEGVTQYLLDWDVPAEKIITLKWWEEHHLNDLTLACTPSRHFSGRGLFDRNSTLWCSYVIKGKTKTVFFSGDSGYHKGFKTIGEKYGPFDLSIMECGQYNTDWALIHMHPTETVQASIDLNSKIVLPIHWGAFSLSVHTWYEPVEVFTAEARQKSLKYITPEIGAITQINEETNTRHWWEKYKN